MRDDRIEDSVTLVIFGASGDLTHRKLMPALYIAFVQGRLPEKFAIVAFARREYQTASYCEMLRESIHEFSRIDVSEEQLELFLEHVSYHRGDIADPAAYEALGQRLMQTERYPENHLFYLSVIPDLFGTAVHSLKRAGLVKKPHRSPWTRVVVEKPFGRDLPSAKALNAELLENLDESQIYRIDHFLGKETVQNILSFRFANAIFDPVFNRSYVDHIQITASETVGMEKGRGGYYDEYGALRDMVTNHLLQLLCLVTMDAPSDLSAEAIRNEKVKILRSLKIDQKQSISDAVIRGQYDQGVDEHAQSIPGYLQEDRIDPNSTTESYIAMRLMIDNWRWAGVPVLLRTGKRMAKNHRDCSAV